MVLLFVATGHGCTYIGSASTLPPIAPPKPVYQPGVEQTVGDFAFTLDGGKLITSNFQGRQLNDAILGAWKEQGYIRDQQHVEAGAFSGTADYDLTLSGSQYGESNVALQLLSGLTLTLIPYSVTQHYDLSYSVKDAKSGQLYSATVQDTEMAYVQLFLIFALPWAVMNHNANMQRIGDHLYDQLRTQGAFESTTAAPRPETQP